MGLKKITVTTMSGQAISFHVNEPDIDIGEGLWVESDDMYIFKKLSGNEISFSKRNVVYIDENDVEDNTDGVTTT